MPPSAPTSLTKLEPTRGRAPDNVAPSRRYVSYVLLCALALIALDLTARFTYGFWPIDKYNSPNRSAIWWAVQDFHKQPYTPDVVLLGSSLMMAAVHGGDATYLNVKENVTLHHKSKYFEDLVEGWSGKPLRTFSFAIGGQMASDAYVLATTYCKGSTKPNSIIYGIAPRDFMDSTFTSPSSTETFKYVARTRDLSSAISQAHPSFWENVDHSLSRASFIYQHRGDFEYVQIAFTKFVLGQIGFRNLDSTHCPFELRRIAMLEMPEDVASNEMIIDPYNAGAAKYTDNLNEYKARYAHLNQKAFADQLRFLTDLHRYCSQNQIKLILVNMPLTAGNVAIMPQRFYEAYLSNISKVVSANGSVWIDLNKPDVFQNKYFEDSVHLNGIGATKFFECLSTALKTRNLSIN